MLSRVVTAVLTSVLLAAWGAVVTARPGRAHGDSRLATLIQSLNGKDWETAIHELASIGDPAVGPLTTVLKAPAWYVRERAVQTLARIGSAAASRSLVLALDDEDGRVRQSAREALAACRERAIPAVARGLDAESAMVRWQAAWVLGHVHAQAVVQPLLRAMSQGDPAVRVESAVGLSRVVAAGVDDGLISLLTNRDPAVRADAAWALGRVRSPRAVDPLIKALGDADTGWMAAVALGELSAASSAPALEGGLRNASARTRRAAAWALARLGAAASIPALEQALGDRDEETRYWAAQALRGADSAHAARAAADSRPTRWDRDARRCEPPRSAASIAEGSVTYSGRSYRLYPETLDRAPEIPSPTVAVDATELVVALTADGKYAIFPVTLKAGSRQCEADADDFPTFARTGLHAEVELDRARTITGRSVAEIAELGRAGRLSDDGFLDADEDIVPVLKADNETVAALGLTHHDLARPLFHIWNMMNTDLDLGRWNMAEHRWGNVTAVLSHERRVQVVAGDTKGGQFSIFADALEGSFWIEINAPLSERERVLLETRYRHLDRGQVDTLMGALTTLRTGEIQPHYITWYGFYEGRTPWRTDPIALAFIFGLRTLEEIEAAFPGRLYELMITRPLPRVAAGAPGGPTRTP